MLIYFLHLFFLYVTPIRIHLGLISRISELSHRGLIFAFPPSSLPPTYFKIGAGPRDPMYCWKIFQNVQKPRKQTVYMLYTALCTDIQVKNVKIQGWGSVQVFGSKKYVKRADIHAHIH
ncbi:hypothetical protein R3W88_020114 [Solanum pinnatisectum]|uniref:Uncharacterized protein n=1 Tax=Solanum pinnatisectum TaxID=50273 RepID=A0AAV9KQE7_9SOLN|nr:hypothetical protein R3W88_020114 [Solanum pinnatisectum]